MSEFKSISLGVRGLEDSINDLPIVNLISGAIQVFGKVTQVRIMPNRKFMLKKIESLREVRVSSMLEIRLRPARINDKVDIFILHLERLESKNLILSNMRGPDGDDKRGMVKNTPRKMGNKGGTKEIKPTRVGKNTINSSGNFTQTLLGIILSEGRASETEILKINGRDKVAQGQGREIEKIVASP